MKYFLFLLIATISFCCIGQGTNIISLRNGATMIETPRSYSALSERKLHKIYSPGALFDETTKPWCSKKNARYPFVFVVELVEEYTLNQLIFDNRCERYGGIETKQVKVEVSHVSKNKGFQKIGEYVLAANEVSSFQIKSNARWVRLTILNNHGNKEYVELAEFKVLGIPSKKLAQPIEINGTWKSNWQNITFKQTGNTFAGYYAYDNIEGTVTNGTISLNAIQFDWQERNLEGTALLYLNEEGDRLSGNWQNSHVSKDFGLWSMTRLDSPKPLIYTNKEVLTDQENIGSTIDAGFFENEVVLKENIILKNVLFVRGKAELLPGAYPELNKLIETLKNDSSLKIELMGYTDNTGSKKLNMELSDKRVDKVKSYLISGGIKRNRISGKGYGPVNPIADNSNESARRLNRRVEFRLTK